MFAEEYSDFPEAATLRYRLLVSPANLGHKGHGRLNMPEHLTITIRTERARDGLIKVVWGDSTGAQFPPYQLFIKPVREKAKAARLALSKLADAYKHPKPDFGEAIANLAACGQELRASFFEDCKPEDRSLARDPLNWFESLVKKEEAANAITVYADPILPIPWGLVHEGEITGETDWYRGFWALRHAIVTLYNGMPPQLLRGARPASNVCILSALNEEVVQGVFQHLDSAEKQLFEDILDRPVGRALTVSGCKKRWAEVGSRDCIIHFFGHATGQKLYLSQNEILTASAFRSTFRREIVAEQYRSNPSYVLTFLNGCASSSGYDADSFMVATAYPGFCGFIGAEAPVPDQFAIFFGQELLHCLLAGGRL